MKLGGMKLGMVVGILAMCLLGCANRQKVTASAGAHASSREVDVPRDFEAAKGRGDLRFIGVQGIRGELLIPGVPDFQEKYATRYRVKVIAGTRGVSDTAAAQAFNDAAWQYGEQYNALLRQAITAQEMAAAAGTTTRP